MRPSIRYVFFIIAFIYYLYPGADCTASAEQPSLRHALERKAGPAGFLAPNDLPNCLKWLPSPPAQGSAAFAADQEIYRNTRKLRGAPQWEHAMVDADIDFPAAAQCFVQALGLPINQEVSPRLYHLLEQSMADARSASGLAKRHYQRIRPFVLAKESSCTPDQEAMLKNSGAYPSGHASIGWVWALILVEIAPDRMDAILSRGFAFGQSRVICGVHWQSDVDAGRVVAAGVVARLHANKAFLAEMEAAKSEVLSLRSRNLKPAGVASDQ